MSPFHVSMDCVTLYLEHIHSMLGRVFISTEKVDSPQNDKRLQNIYAYIEHSKPSVVGLTNIF